MKTVLLIFFLLYFYLCFKNVFIFLCVYAFDSLDAIDALASCLLCYTVVHLINL